MQVNDAPDRIGGLPVEGQHVADDVRVAAPEEGIGMNHAVPSPDPVRLGGADGPRPVRHDQGFQRRDRVVQCGIQRFAAGVESDAFAETLFPAVDPIRGGGEIGTSSLSNWKAKTNSSPSPWFPCNI